MTERNLGNIVEIMKNDFKSAFSNPIVTIVLIGIIILPSLYALINIGACWDPYEETGEIEFAVVNLDKGASFEGYEINIGNELVKDLNNNDKFKWTFVSEEELREGVYKGDYYAGIIIPENLSENVVSIMTDDPKQAELEYVVNVKANPVAAKLTDSAANAVYTTLNAKIIEVINLAAYDKLGELQSGLSSGAGQLYSGGTQLSAGSAQVASGAGQVEDGAKQVQGGASNIQEGAKQVQGGANDVKQGAGKVEQGSQELQSAVDPSLIPPGPVKEYVEANVALANGSGEVAKGSVKLADGSVQLADGSVQLANGSSDLAKGSLSLAAGSMLLSNAATQALFSAAGALYSSAQSLSGITGINETLLGEYFFSPVKLDKHELFPVPNYGSQVAPFYLVLSMWVGAIITCAMLKPGISEGTKYSHFDMYCGKLLLFIIMSILQAVVTIIGSIILGIFIDNLLLFILSSILVSIVFMILMYSLVSALGNVGKAVAVVLLVIQISGTGGVYPVQIMHPFFQMLHPYLPMTYAINLIREAQLGLVWSNYIPALIILLAMGIVIVIVSIIVKEKADKRAHYFEQCLDDSGLF